MITKRLPRRVTKEETIYRAVVEKKKLSLEDFNHARLGVADFVHQFRNKEITDSDVDNHITLSIEKGRAFRGSLSTSVAY